MKKRLKIFLTVIVSIFSFIFIGNVKAYQYYNVDLNDEFFNTLWSNIEGKTPNDLDFSSFNSNYIYHQSDYSYVSCTKSPSSQVYSCFFFKNIDLYSSLVNTSSGKYFTIYFTNKYDALMIQYNKSNNSINYQAPFNIESQGSYRNYYYTNIYQTDNTYQKAYCSNFDIQSNNFTKDFDYDPNPQPNNITFHVNGGTVRHNYDPINLLFDGTNDFTVELYPNEIEYFITNIEVNKYLMLFEGWYYDSNFTQPFTLNDHITTDVDLYAKFRYEKVEDFLANTTLNMHTFDDNYNYAIINRGDNGDSVYIGLPFEAYNLEVYEYSESEYKVKDGASACPVPLYSKNGYYYYDINTLFTNNQEVLILPRGLFDELDPNDFQNANDIYKFYLSDNGYISYTNDLSQAEIVNSNGEQISINLQDSYELSQQYQELYSKPENIFEQMNIFLDKMKKITSAVKDIFSYLFNSLNSTIKSFITYLIIIILVTAIIRFARRG